MLRVELRMLALSTGGSDGEELLRTLKQMLPALVHALATLAHRLKATVPSSVL